MSSSVWRQQHAELLAWVGAASAASAASPHLLAPPLADWLKYQQSLEALGEFWVHQVLPAITFQRADHARPPCMQLCCQGLRKDVGMHKAQKGWPDEAAVGSLAVCNHVQMQLGLCSAFANLCLPS